MKKAIRILVLVLAVSLFTISGYYDLFKLKTETIPAVTEEMSQASCTYVHDHNVDCGFIAKADAVEGVACNFVCTHEADCNYVEGVGCEAVCDHSACSYIAAIEAVEGVACSVVHEHNECGYVEQSEAMIEEKPIGEVLFNWLTKGTAKNIFIFRLALLGAGLILVALYALLGKKRNKKKSPPTAPVIPSSTPKGRSRRVSETGTQTSDKSNNTGIQF